MKRRIITLFFLANFLLTLGMSSFAPFIPSPKASAATPAPGANFALSYPDTDEFRKDLEAAAADGGLGPDDIQRVLNETALYTRGGRLGTQQLKLDADMSNKHDMPIYSIDYYCYPGEKEAQFYTSSPNTNKIYVRYKMGVALFDNKNWKGIAEAGPYKTYAGVLGDDTVGTLHLPERVTSEGRIGGADYDIPGKGGDNDVRTGIDLGKTNTKEWDELKQGVANEEPGFDSKVLPAGLGAPAVRLDKMLSGCLPSFKGNLDKATIYVGKTDKQGWLADINKAGIGGGNAKSLADATASTAGSTNSGAGADDSQLACKVDGLSFSPTQMVENVLNWLFCGFVQGLMGIVNTLDRMINDLLSVGSPGNESEPTQIFGGNNGTNCKESDTCYAYYAAWESFRNIALGLMLIAGLIVLIAQALGMEILDAYTIRKVLPRLLIAAVAITLSWQLMQLAVEFTNDVGYGIRRIMYAPFEQLGAGISLNGGESLSLIIISGIGLAFAGLFGLLSLVATAAIAIFIAFLVLILREIAIIMLIIMAPVGIVAYILPNTQRVFKLWWESFSKALLMFPLIAALIAAGRIFSAIALSQDGTINKLIGFFAYFAPYFILPMTFQFAGGFVRQLGGFVNDRGQGAMGALKNFRAGQRKKNTAAMAAGTRYQGKRWLPGSTKAANAFNEATKGLGSGWEGRYGFGSRGRQARRYVDQRAAEEAMKSPGMQAVSGWNDVNRILATGMGDERAGRDALRRHLELGGDDGKFGAGMSDSEKQAAIESKINQAAMAAKVAGGFTKANGIAAFNAMARDGTAIRDTDDLANLASIVGQGDKNNTFKYAAEAASVSRQVGRSDLAAASEPIGELAFAYSDLRFNNGLTGMSQDQIQSAMPSLSNAAWASGAGGEVAYTKFSSAKGRTIKNDTRRAVDIMKNHRDAIMNGRQSIYTEDQVKFAAATLMDTQNAIDNQYGKLNNREAAQGELAKDDGALNWYLDTATTVTDEKVTAYNRDDGTPMARTPITETSTRQTTNREVIQKMVGDRYASLTPEQRLAAQKQQAQEENP